MSTNKNDKISEKFFISNELSNKLNSIKTHYLTAVIGPSGLGKTSALIHFINKNKMNCSWFSVTKNDDIAKHFWRKLCDCFGIDESLYIGNFPDNIIKQSFIFNTIKNKYSKSPPQYIIIDNYNLIKNPVIDEFIKNITLQQIDNLHIVLITNKNLPDVLDSLASVNLVNEIDGTAFELNDTDIMEYFYQNNLKISTLDSKEIALYSNGWALIVNFVMHDFLKTSTLNLSQDINLFIEQSATECFSKTEIEILKRLCIFEEFDLDVASFAVSDKDIRPKIVNISNKSNLIEYNNFTNKYKISNILKSILKKNFDFKNQQQINIIHERAGYFLIKNGFFVDGINELYASQNYIEIINSFKNESHEVLKNFSNSQIIKFIQAIDDDVKVKYFMTLLHFCIYLSANGKCDYAKNLIEHLVESYKVSWLRSADADRKLLGEVNVALFFTNAKFSLNALEFLKIGDEYLPNSSDLINHKIDFNTPCLLILSQIYDGKSSLKTTFKIGLDTFKLLCKMSKGVYSKCFCEYLTSEYLFMTADFKTAKKYIWDCVKKAENCGEYTIVLRCTFLLLQIMFIENDAPSTIQVFEKQQQLLTLPHFNKMAYLFELLCINLSITTKQNFSFSNIKDKTLLYIGDLASSESDELNEKIKATFENENLPIGKIQINLFEAINARKNYGDSFAKIYIKTAIEVAQKDNIIYPFISMCDDLIDLISEIKNENIFKNDYMNLLLEVCQSHKNALTHDKPCTKPSISLTSREIEVAKALVECKSNKEMAINFNIKEGTVKKIIYNLYQKMEVNSRATAVKKIIESGIANFN